MSDESSKTHYPDWWVASLPVGHVEGFADSFFTLFRQVYSDVLAGGRSNSSTYAGFEDEHQEMLFCDAVLQSAKEGRWVDVPKRN